MLGLTTGHFDIDVKLLRTCSEPDLSKLFKTEKVEDPFLFSGAQNVAASLSVEAQDREVTNIISVFMYLFG